ncbi:hypothetical protein [Chondromyces crocatus]|uniref:Uncharacterized protein n=1 Tax=Chondromyces crocatus TaxID=52 RepID=A0A0K1ENS4_CHOCO|nr:hypothetical protein [Chondromyces crocatus]AKT42506.1 uncharacterized protein CMC5_067320 [Chondromyces crocatus]
MTDAASRLHSQSPKPRAGGAGPDWPYPEPAGYRSVHKPLLEALVYGFICLVVTVVSLVLAVPRLEGELLLGLSGVALAIVFAWLGVRGVRDALEEARVGEETVRAGLPCWGRIVHTARGQYANKVNHLRWIQMKLTVEPYAAKTSRSIPGERQYAVGERVAEQVTFTWYISELQMAMLQPGHYCAFLLHPTHRSKVYLDSFATPQGSIVPLQ